MHRRGRPLTCMCMYAQDSLPAALICPASNLQQADETDDMQRVETTVFELAGADRPGLLAEVTHLLTHNGCNVRSAAVWTYRGRVAFVLSGGCGGRGSRRDG